MKTALYLRVSTDTQNHDSQLHELRRYCEQRSWSNIVEFVDVAFVATSQGIDTSNDNPAGRLQLGVLMAVAEFEREIIRERVKAGLSAARAWGKRLGRPVKIDNEVVQALKAEGLGVRAIARRPSLSPSTVSSALRA